MELSLPSMTLGGSAVGILPVMERRFYVPEEVEGINGSEQVRQQSF